MFKLKRNKSYLTAAEKNDITNLAREKTKIEGALQALVGSIAARERLPDGWNFDTTTLQFSYPTRTDRA